MLAATRADRGFHLVIVLRAGWVGRPRRCALRPLRRIAGTTKRIAAGDLSQRVDLTGPDEPSPPCSLKGSGPDQWRVGSGVA
ncbi:MAG: HAMP domain-containing protein [Egibacteraceae bacterium]